MNAPNHIKSNIHRTGGAILSILTLAGILGTGVSSSAAEGSVGDVFEKALYAEQTRGDIDAAMPLFQQVIADIKAGQSLAAQAQYHLGLCHYKKGQYAEASAAFEKVIKDYPDEKELVRLAGDYLAGTVNLQPAPWTDGEVMRVDMKFRTGIKAGWTRYFVLSGEQDGRPIWRLGMQLNVGTQQASRVEVDAATFKPLHSRRKISVMGDVDAVYSAGRVDARLKGEAETKTTGYSGLCYDNEEVIQLIRRLPLAEGYTTSLPIFVSYGNTVISLKLTVAGKESVTVPAGTFECFKIKLSMVNQTFWYSADAHRYMVKMDAGAVIGELAKVEQGDAKELAKELESMFEFVAGEPGGGVPTVEPAASQPLQIQAKLLVLGARSASSKTLPEASNWVDALNAAKTRLPAIPANTVFAMNAKVSGLEWKKVNPATVVFFETATAGVNQSGGPDLLAKKPAGVAVAFADGRALLVGPDEIPTLRWDP